MDSAYQNLIQEYSKLKNEEQQESVSVFSDPFKVIDPLESFMQSRNDDIVLCSRNMALLYLSARLCQYNIKSNIHTFENNLLSAEACAKKVLDKKYSVYIFIKIALCDTASFADSYLALLKPKFMLIRNLTEAETLIHYILKLSQNLYSSSYSWYGKKMVKNTIHLLQSQKVPVSANKAKLLTSLKTEYKKYHNVKEVF